MTTVTSYILLRNSTNQLILAACDVISKRTQPTVETLRWINSNVTGQEKVGNMRPPRGVRVKEDYRQWAGHEIHLEKEDVLDKIKIK